MDKEINVDKAIETDRETIVDQEIQVTDQETQTIIQETQTIYKEA